MGNCCGKQAEPIGEEENQKYSKKLDKVCEWISLFIFSIGDKTK